MMTRANIETFVISQHSWGIGHLTRASTIAKAFSSISHVTMFSGGRPVEGYSAPSDVDFVQIPAIRRPIASSEDFDQWVFVIDQLRRAPRGKTDTLNG
jgi:predicted glycosyltransferase